MTEVAAEVLSGLRGTIQRDLRAGFEPLDDIIETAVEVMADEGVEPATLRPYAEKFMAEALVELEEESKSWPATTDCDRLDLAFADLEAQGVVARQNFSCCQNCGHGEIWDEVQAELEKGRSVIGYTFYHQQDTESAVEDGSLFLAYGATEDGEPELLAVARRIVETVSRHGFTVVWDGTVARRIRFNLKWQKRLA